MKKKIFHISTFDEGHMSQTVLSNMSHRSSIGLRSMHCGGQAMLFKTFSPAFYFKSMHNLEHVWNNYRIPELHFVQEFYYILFKIYYIN